MRNWTNLVVDLTSIVAPTIVGPFDIEADALLVQAGQHAQLFLLDELVSADALATFGIVWLYDVGLPHATAGAFMPFKLSRFWLAAGAAPATQTVLTFFRDVRVPATR